MEPGAIPVRMIWTNREVTMRCTMGLAILASLLGAGCDMNEPAPFEEAVVQEHTLASGGQLSLDSFNGTVEIEGWAHERIEIRAVKYARTPEALRDLAVEVAAGPHEVLIRSVRPPRDGRAAGVRYRIRVPRQTRIERVETTNGAIMVTDVEGAARLKTTNGLVRVTRVRGAVDAATSNAGVEVEGIDGPAALRTSNARVRAAGVRGGLWALTTNGSIEARLVAGTPDDLVKLETTNGFIDLALEKECASRVEATTSNAGITVRMPEDSSASVHAQTRNAAVRSEFEIAGSARPDHLDGVIGAGGRRVELNTSNASIELIKL